MEYNLAHEKIEVYKPFPGKNREQMPALLAEGRTPLWKSRLMRRRIDHSKELPDLKDYLDVGDLIAYDRKDRSSDLKIILTTDNQGRLAETGKTALALINPSVKLTSDYAVPLGENYGALQGEGIVSLSRDKLGIMGRDLTEGEILSSKAWRILARHPDEVSSEFAEDKDLLREYARWVASQTKECKNMGIYLDSNSDVEKLRASCIWRLVGRSRLIGWSILDDDDGRLVGYLAPEAQSAPDKVIVKPSLETALSIVNEHIQKAGISLRRN